MKHWIQISLSILLLCLLLYIIDLNKTIETFKQASYSYVILIFITITVNRIIMAYKWNILLNANKIFVPFIEILKIYYISNFAGLFLPATIGGDIVRLFMVNKKVKKVPEIIASITIERIIGFIILFIIALIALIYFLSSFKKDPVVLVNLEILIIAFTVTGLILIVLSFNKKLIKSLENLLYLNKSNFIKKIVNKIEHFYNAYYTYRNSKKEIILFSLLTVAEITTVIIWSYFGILAFNQQVDIVYVFAVVPVITIINRLPVSFDGFGTNESGYVYFLSFVGIQNHIAFSIGLFIHLTTILGVLPGALFYALDKNKIDEIKKYKIEEAVG